MVSCSCSVIGCKSRTERCEPNVSFHTFPLNDDTRQQWILATGRQNWNPFKYSPICSKHFEAPSFRKKLTRVFVIKTAKSWYPQTMIILQIQQVSHRIHYATKMMNKKESIRKVYTKLILFKDSRLVIKLREMSLEEIEVRHKKEKKELQAQIQGLKKIGKNDKTKKKELITEIARLESEMEFRHKEELAAVENQLGKPENTVSPDEDVETPKLKVSKAQKRRDKKTQQEKERTEQIKLQEKENLHGPRNIEIQSITNKLKERYLTIFSIPSDGDCLYQAVAHQLITTRSKTMSVEELRKQVASFIRQNKDDFLPFMSNPNTFDMLSESEFNNYCDEIINTKVWGGQLEIRALSNSLRCPINVIQATGPECIEQGAEFEGPPLIITYHRHMYKLGEHYNSTQAISENDS